MKRIVINGITLPRDVTISVENLFDYSGVSCIEDKNMEGGPLIWEGTEYGRKLTINSSSENMGAILYGDLKVLVAMTKTPNNFFEIDYYGERSVIARFDHANPPVISAVPVYKNKPTFDDGDIFHSLNIRIMELSQ